MVSSKVVPGGTPSSHVRAAQVNRVRRKSAASDRDIIEQVLYPVVCVNSSVAAESRRHEIAIAGRDAQREAGCRRHHCARVAVGMVAPVGLAVAGWRWRCRVPPGNRRLLPGGRRGGQATAGSCCLPYGGRRSPVSVSLVTTRTTLLGRVGLIGCRGWHGRLMSVASRRRSLVGVGGETWVPLTPWPELGNWG